MYRCISAHRTAKVYVISVLRKFDSWADLALWSPTLQEVRQTAREIMLRYSRATEAVSAHTRQDEWLAHSIYFIRDALLFCEFEDAVAHADPGRVIRIMKYWALSFAGAGQHNYARECVEVLIKWRYELHPALRIALEKSWFVDRWGKPGRWIAADLYLEQCNFWVKVRKDATYLGYSLLSMVY